MNQEITTETYCNKHLKQLRKNKQGRLNYRYFHVCEVHLSVAYISDLGATCIIKHNGYDSSVCCLRVIILFHRFEYGVGIWHLAKRILLKSLLTELWRQLRSMTYLLQLMNQLIFKVSLWTLKDNSSNGWRVFPCVQTPRAWLLSNKKMTTKSRGELYFFYLLMKKFKKNSKRWLAHVQVKSKITIKQWKPQMVASFRR